MHQPHPTAPIAALVLMLVLPLGARDERADLDAIARIRDEAQRHSQLIETARSLTDLYGSRLTGSPGLRAAADYVLGRLTQWGFSTARLEGWGPFGPGWSNDRIIALAVSPRRYPLVAYSKAWTPGTSGPVIADAILAPVNSERDFAAYRGRLKGKFVLTTSLGGASDAGSLTRNLRSAGDLELARKRMQFFLDEGAAALIERGGDRSAIFAGDGRLAPRDEAGLYPWPEEVAPQLVLAGEHYDWIARTLEIGVPVTLELDIVNTYYNADPDSFNVIAEIPGRSRGEKVVMVGAHLDSWHVGSGAIDSAAGCAVVLEAARILKATGLDMKHTVRIALWTGTKQGALGSRAYVRQHFFNAAGRSLEPQRAAFSAYFNLDQGTGAIRGIALNGHDSLASTFRAWMAPFASSAGAMSVSQEKFESSDASSFEAMRLPGFEFVQESTDDERRVRGTNLDSYDRLRTMDLIQNAVVVASVIYHAASRED